MHTSRWNGDSDSLRVGAFTTIIATTPGETRVGERVAEMEATTIIKKYLQI